MSRVVWTLTLVFLGSWVTVAAAAPPMATTTSADPALPVCSPAQVEAIEAALREAPMSAEVPEDAPAGAAPVKERRCGLSQGQSVRKVLASCKPAATQAVVYLGAGRCVQQAGYGQEAARAFRAYLATGDPSVSPERGKERRDRVRRWLKELGDEAPPSSLLVLGSNLRGPLVTHLQDYPDGVTLEKGDNRIGQPPGPRRLSLALPGFDRVELKVDLIDGETSRAEVDWRQHLSPRYLRLLGSWDDFAKSNLTPSGFYARKQRPITIVLSMLLAGAGAALIGVCAANVNDACDSAWKEGLAYGFGATLALSGLLGTLTTLATPLEAMPQPGLTHIGAAERY